MNLKSSAVLALSVGLCFSQLCFAEPAPAAATHPNDQTWPKLSNLMGKDNKDIQNHISLFFIQKANMLKIVPDPDNKKSNCYKIILTKPWNNVIYFSDAPKRVTGTVSISKFLSSWQHGFTSPNSGPNGVIHGVLDNKDTGDIVTLTNPVYNNDHEEMTYSVCSMQRNNKIFTDGEVLHNVLIFIDPISPWPP